MISVSFSALDKIPQTQLDIFPLPWVRITLLTMMHNHKPSATLHYWINEQCDMCLSAQRSITEGCDCINQSIVELDFFECMKESRKMIMKGLLGS